MGIINKNIKKQQLQVAIWIFVFVTNFLPDLQYDPLAKALALAILTILYYAAIICGNALWLIPAFYNRHRFIPYALLVLLLLTVTALLRSIAATYIDNAFSIAYNENLTTKTLSYSALGSIWIFFFSIMYRLAMDYFALSKKQDEIKAEKAQTELNLLKQQVHPHFLFNTLNNIYYVAHKDSPQAADLIERLSVIIRYFIEESQKARVYLKDEIELLESYIELERITMRYEMPVDFLINGNIEMITVPPLLLLPLVENIFKHGIDKRSKDNFAEIRLTINKDQLLFITKNRHFQTVETVQGGKTGLNNLEKRLKLYYGDNYQLTMQNADNIFIATLQIPAYEN